MPDHDPTDAPSGARSATPGRSPGPLPLWTIVARGVAMGSADLVPGVSGGTMALILGIYPRLIAALSNLTRAQTWGTLRAGRIRRAWLGVDGPFLTALATGIAVAVLALARALDWTLEHHPVPLYAVFFGMIAASAWAVLQEVRARPRVAAVWALIGALIAFVMTGLAPTVTPDRPLAYLLAGAIGVSALLLPGVSGAFLLLLLGKYEQVLAAVTRFDLAVLGPFGVGLVIGLLAFARLIAAALRRWPSAVLGVLAGFLVGSLRKVWPWQDELAVRTVVLAPPNVGEALLAATVMIVAAGLVVVAQRASVRGRAPRTDDGGDGSSAS
ncbi:MAG: DUF368 domain-containing protein [Trueperaceae bacterium]